MEARQRVVETAGFAVCFQPGQPSKVVGEHIHHMGCAPVFDGETDHLFVVVFLLYPFGSYLINYYICNYAEFLGIKINNYRYFYKPRRRQGAHAWVGARQLADTAHRQPSPTGWLSIAKEGYLHDSSPSAWDKKESLMKLSFLFGIAIFLGGKYKKIKNLTDR